VTASVRISDPRLLGDFGEFLRRATCRVAPAGDSALEVEVPGAAREAEERLRLFVAAWRGLHPNVEAEWVSLDVSGSMGRAAAL
jgi:hypothetical protein